MIEYYATCPKGLEQLLIQEIKAIGAEFKRETVGGVWFDADLKTAYKVCLWSRIANKVLQPVGNGKIKADDDIYTLARDVAWEQYLSPTGTIWVDFQGTNELIRNSQYGALKVKDGIVDRFRNLFSERPSVEKNNPDLQIIARLNKGVLTLYMDMCGESLHKRGYRQKQGAAPLKENLAAALLYRANWPELAQQGAALLDPMCGSGTILIEGAMMAANMAPGISRAGFAFERWLNYDKAAWLDLREEALAAIDLEKIPEIRGYDINKHVLESAEHNIHKAGLGDKVRVITKPVSAFKKPTHTHIDHGLILTNPPYGERLGEIAELGGLYRELGTAMRTDFKGWQAGVFTGNLEAAKNMGLKAHKKYKLNNGSLATELLLFDIKEEFFVNTIRDPHLARRRQLSEGATMVLNRLNKNKKQLSKWIKNYDIECYRLYDADIPEYSAAIDVYGDYYHIQEYQAPKSVDEKKAQTRFEEIVSAVECDFQTDEAKISLKQRRRNKGTQQYQKLTDQKSQHPLILVQEGAATFEVNLWDYLDTGLFLDHRPVRREIYNIAEDKKFLNLFCYTGTASVQAALGGARETVSVDLSNTYINWAKRNFQLNKLVSNKHRFEQADCFEWLKNCREGFDLILLDPPSFSNSKKTESILDIQRDHVGLIKRCMDLLTKDGILIFSNNLRSFKLNQEELAHYKVTDFKEESIDPDFKRNSKIHHCWLIEH